MTGGPRSEPDGAGRLEAQLLARHGGFELEAELILEPRITAMFGRNGSGKSTLLHALAGLLPTVSGTLRLDGRVLLDTRQRVFVPARRRRIGVVFQDLRLFPHRSVLGNLLYGRPRRHARLALDDVVEALELGALIDRSAAELSGGERQRVALGRALLAEPDWLLLDEPLASLDVGLRQQILPYLQWIHQRYELPILYVSHSLAEILDLTNDLIVLDEGRVLGHGEVFEVLSNTLVGERGAAFAAESSLLVEVEMLSEEGDWLRAKIGEQLVILPFRTRSPGTWLRVAVRPDDVVLATQRLSGVSARNQLRGIIRRLSGLHGRLLVHIELAPDQTVLAEITRDALFELRLEVGDPVYCVIKTSAFRYRDR